MANPKTTFEFDGDIKKVLAKLDELDAKIAMTGKKSGSAGSDMLSGFEGAVAGIAKVTAALGAAYAALSTAGKAIGTAAEFEQLQTRLENMYGSVEKGREAFQKFQEVAATTPYSLQGVVEAGASLKAFGVDAEKMIKPVSDLAAFMGVDVVEAAQAFGRAMAGGAGAADVLRERGILNLVKSFKGIDDLTKLTLPQFRKALIETIQDPAAGIVGATDKMSKTFKGAYSNMLDAVDQLANVMGKKLLPAATSVMQSISGMIGNALPRQSQLLRENQIEFQALAGAITDVNTLDDTRKRLIKELQDKYGSYLGNINIEKANYQDLKKAIDDANIAFEQKIKLAAAEEVLGDQQKKIMAEQVALANRTKEFYQFIGEQNRTWNASTDDELKRSRQRWEDGIDARKENIQKLQDEYKQLYDVLVKGEGLEGQFGQTTTPPPPKPDPNAAGAAGKANADAYLREWRGTLATVKEMDAPLWNEMIKWFERVDAERAKLDDGFKLIGEQTVPATTEAYRKSAEETVKNLQGLESQLENVVGSLTRAGVAGENMGDALKKVLQDLISKAITLAVVFGIMQLIPGGGALAGGFGAFMGKGFGLGSLLNTESAPGSASGGATSALLQSEKPLVVQLTGVLEGQKFVANTVRSGEARLGGRLF